MNSPLKRPYRKNLTTRGLIYVDGKEQEITLKNLSLTGVLATLKNPADINRAVATLSEIPTLDLYLPELRIAGEADIVRVEAENNHISIALQFKTISYQVDEHMYKRKAYRKAMSVPGRLLLDAQYRDFISINVSTDGLMIHLPDPVAVNEGEITLVEFKELNMEGQVKIVWSDAMPDGGTLMGLQYVTIAQIPPTT